ncbi:MAG: RNase adapter RapZ [Rhodospirillales bacterium]|nr:RNase adapter RapZ [Rhodospirillales bacterium]
MPNKKQTPDGDSRPRPEAAGASALFRVLLVTGMSGAGKTAALKDLEDMGYEAVDNLPLSLVSALVAPAVRSGLPIAIGIDIRTRDFGIAQFLHEIDELIANGNYDARLLFLDCDDDVLQRRFTETRRRHPLALDRPVADGIRHERRLMSELRDRADLVVDTSSLILGDLKRVLHGHFALDASPGIVVFVTSFSYRRGLPPEADIVFDARFLANPHYVDELRDLTGLDSAVGAYVAADEGFDVFFDSVTTMLGALLPRFSQEGKSYLTIAVGCTGGKHRSVYVAEQIAAWLCENGEQAGISHRDLPGARSRT